ncbi:MAG: hypothetical protein RLZZ500_1687 [Bacteroidota bacterium]|jgi:hypothetical protein
MKDSFSFFVSFGIQTWPMLNILFRFIKQCLQFYVAASLHIGLAICALFWVGQHLQAKEILPVQVVQLFFGTVVAYNALKYSAVLRYKQKLNLKIILIIIISLVAAMGYVYLFWQQNVKTQYAWLVGMVGVGIYPWLRPFGVFKLFWVSAVVTYCTVMLSFMSQLLVPDLKIVLLQFLMVSALMIPFEIHDSVTDARALQTLPQKYGISTAKRIGYTLLFGFTLLQFLCVDPIHFLPNCGMAMGVAVAIHFTKINQSHWYTSFWVEALPWLWVGLFLFL